MCGAVDDVRVVGAAGAVVAGAGAVVGEDGDVVVEGSAWVRPIRPLSVCPRGGSNNRRLGCLGS